MAWRQVKPPEESFACNFDAGICKNWLQVCTAGVPNLPKEQIRHQ